MPDDVVRPSRRVPVANGGAPPGAWSRGRRLHRHVVKIVGGCCLLSGAWGHAGPRTAQPVEIELWRWHDVCDRRIQNAITAWLGVGDFGAVWLSTPRNRWLVAISTGKRGTHADELGFSCSEFTLPLLKRCWKLGLYRVMENFDSLVVRVGPSLPAVGQT